MLFAKVVVTAAVFGAKGVVCDMRSLLASIVSHTESWPSGVHPYMEPTGTPSAAKCIKSLDGLYQLYSITPIQHFAAAFVTNDDGSDPTSQSTMATGLINGTLLSSTGSIGSIVATHQLPWDGPPRAGAIYTAGWSVCGPEMTLYLGNQSVFYECDSGHLTKYYSEKIDSICSKVNIQLRKVPGSDQISPASSSSSSSSPSPLSNASLATTLTSTLISTTPKNPWAVTLDVNEEQHTVYDPYPVVTVDGIVYSAITNLNNIPVGTKTNLIGGKTRLEQAFEKKTAIIPVVVATVPTSPTKAASKRQASSAAPARGDDDHRQPGLIVENYVSTTATAVIATPRVVQLDKGESGTTFTIAPTTIVVTDDPWSVYTAVAAVPTVGAALHKRDDDATSLTASGHGERVWPTRMCILVETACVWMFFGAWTFFFGELAHLNGAAEAEASTEV